MILKIRQSIAVSMMGLMLVLSGCGGGSSSSSSRTPEPAPATTKVAGTASKGVVFPGSVSIYALDLATGGKTTAPALATVLTDSKGQYSADLGVYSGPIVIEVTGTYTDEATNSPVLISSARPMRAIVAEVTPGNTKRFAVTPLTDLAATLAIAVLPVTPGNIVAANAKISELFKISDILTVEPVDANAAVLGALTTTDADEKRAYTLALAVISQMAKNNSAGAAADFSQIDALLTTLKSDLTSTGLGVPFANALTTVTTQPGSVFAGFPVAAATLGNVGTTTMKITLSAGQTTAAALIGIIEGDIQLPVGASIRADSTSQVLPGLFTFTGSSPDVMPIATYTASSRVLRFKIVTPRGYAGGDFATFLVDVSSGAPTAVNFALTNERVIDVNTNVLNIPVTIK